MGMTLAVYKINPETGARTQVRRRRTVRPAGQPDVSGRYPPCACPRCVDISVSLTAKVAEANKRTGDAQ